ncbi:MAG: hypothetical protein KY397_02925, partial [Gemmatimonadetes bacterium]|nr:hypothetical protein [Gemmatimonadota bacterium]
MARSKTKNGTARRRGVRILGGLAVVLLVALAAYMVVLERRVTAKWEGRKWSVPSKVYSDAYLLHPGKDLDARDFEARLQRLGYLEQSGGVDEPGEYAKGENRWLVYLHAFAYPDGDNPAYPVRIETGGGVIREVTHGRTGENLTSAALEPEVIGVIFDRHMEDRTPIDLEEIPQHLVEAVLAVEDAVLQIEMVHSSVPVRRAVGQYVGEHPVAAAGKDRFRVELQAPLASFDVADRHHDPVRLRMHPEPLRNVAGAEAVIAPDRREAVDAAEGSGPIMVEEARLAVHRLRRPRHFPACLEDDRLVTEADAEQ